MKNFKEILKDEVMFLINGRLDTLKLKSIEDAKLFLFRQNLEASQSHVRLAEFSSAFKKLHPHILTVFLFYATSSHFIVALKLFNPQLSAGFPEVSFQTLVLLKVVFFPLCLFIGFLVKFPNDTRLLSAL